MDDDVNAFKSEAGRAYVRESDSDEDAVGGIDIEKAKRVLKEEDKYDKELFRRRMRELKLRKKAEKREDSSDEEEEDEEEESDEGDEGPDLGWLPDPSKVYGEKEGGQSDEEEERGEESEVEAEPEVSDDDSEPAEKSKGWKEWKKKWVKVSIISSLWYFFFLVLGFSFFLVDSLHQALVHSKCRFSVYRFCLLN